MQIDPVEFAKASQAQLEIMTRVKVDPVVEEAMNAIQDALQTVQEKCGGEMLDGQVTAALVGLLAVQMGDVEDEHLRMLTGGVVLAFGALVKVARQVAADAPSVMN